MIGSLRIGLALLIIGTVSLPMMALQLLALRTGKLSEKRLPRIWHRIALKVLGVRVRVVGQVARHRPLLLASNHISWTDISVLGSIAEVSFIAKSQVAGWPVIGTLSRLQRSVHIDRERRGGSGDQAREISRRLAAGDAIVLFAEGTTSDGNIVQPFKSSLFGAARLALQESGTERVFIQPVAISYTRIHGMPMGRQHRPIASWIGDSDLVPHVASLLREGAIDVQVEFGEPVEFTAESSRKEIARLVEHRVKRMREHVLRGRGAM